MRQEANASVGKTTLSRAIKAGRLSASRTDTGSYEIDPAELHRVYPFKPPTDTTGETVAATGGPEHHATPNATLEVQIAGLKEVGELLRQQLDDIRTDRDCWRSQAERLVLPAPVLSVSRPWWRRLAG
jgi:hypothetical protein